jgi:hypothetical protein
VTEYTFDVRLIGTVQILAESEAAARQLLRNLAGDTDPVLSPDDPYELTYWAVDDTNPELIGIDGVAVG